MDRIVCRTCITYTIKVNNTMNRVKETMETNLLIPYNHNKTNSHLFYFLRKNKNFIKYIGIKKYANRNNEKYSPYAQHFYQSNV